MLYELDLENGECVTKEKKQILFNYFFSLIIVFLKIFVTRTLKYLQ